MKLLDKAIFGMVLTAIPLFFFLQNCGGSSSTSSNALTLDKKTYIQNLEKENGISYQAILNPGAYIPPMCYTKTEDEKGDIHNLCYPCHTAGKPPNYWSDTELQESYDFPEVMFKNPYKNLFTDISKELSQISDNMVLDYIRNSNYFDQKGEIVLKSSLPKDWQGYVPDCYFNFDDQGFDINPFTKQYTGWRAFQYYPFPGTFWPTNGSTDDVLIRLPVEFRQDESGRFNLDIYKINLAILEVLVKQTDITFDEKFDEKLAGIDLDGDGKLSQTNIIKFRKELPYVGMAGKLLKERKLYSEPGLFPQGTEFLHTVRYIDWDDKDNLPKPSSRIKEVRYAYKEEWFSSMEIQSLLWKKMEERHPSKSVNPQPQLEAFGGDFEKGMKNSFGWRYSGFIEDKNGNLRPQTNEETTYCMGCHDTIGATTDSTFSFVRKFSWGYWREPGLKDIPEPVVNYKKYGNVGEYSFYLKNNKSGNEFRNNKEVIDKFFNPDGTIKQDMLEKLKTDISVLLYPSRERAMNLNKAYMVLVKRQGYIFGREQIGNLENTVHKLLEKGKKTGIIDTIY